MARAYPSVSLLLSTTPSRLPTSRDVQRLDRLIQQAASRLESEMSGDAGDRLVARLRGLATRLRRHPAGHGLGLFVSEHRSAAIQLPVPVLDRVVVDPTFATRDLVRALHLSPRHRVLVVSGRSARLYEGAPARCARWRTACSLFPRPPQPTGATEGFASAASGHEAATRISAPTSGPSMRR